MTSSKPLRISPSQIKRFRLCPRKSAFQLTSHTPAPSTWVGANDLGTRCHSIAEAWLRDGLFPDITETFAFERGGRSETAYPGAIVTAGLHLLPTPRTAHVEVGLASGGYASRADWTEDDGTVGDHKFVRDLSYALSPDDLAGDPQAVIQAALQVEKGFEKVPLTWVYYETKITGGRYKTRRVHLVLDADTVRDRMRPIERDSQRIHAIHRMQVDPLRLPPNPSACMAYGRACEWQGYCGNMDPFDGVDDMDEKIDQLLASLAPPPPPPPPPDDDDDDFVVRVNPPEEPAEDGGFGPLAEAPVKDPVLVPAGAAMDRATVKALLVERGVIQSGDRRSLAALVPLLSPEPAQSIIHRSLEALMPLHPEAPDLDDLVTQIYTYHGSEIRALIAIILRSAGAK